MTTCYRRLLNDRYLLPVANLAISRINCGLTGLQSCSCRSYCVNSPDAPSETITKDERAQTSDAKPSDTKSVKCETNVETLSSEILSESKISMKEAALPDKDKPPDLPTICCMSGCANCVWIEYAEELANYYGDGGNQAREAIRKIPDPNLRAFLEMELKLG